MLEMKDVRKNFRTGPPLHRSQVEAVRGVSLSVEEGRICALVGESGSGKTTLLYLLAGLYRPGTGSVLMEDRPVADYPEKQRFIRLQLVLQDGKSALDPHMPVGKSIEEPMRNLGLCSGRQAKQKAMDLMTAVGLSPDQFGRRPAELSGGEQKRVCLARALSANPRYLLFDEATAGLDPVRRRQVLDLILRLQKERGFGALFVTHDLEVAFYMAETIWIMKEGKIVETLESPFSPGNFRHPYTRLLMEGLL